MGKPTRIAPTDPGISGMLPGLAGTAGICAPGSIPMLPIPPQIPNLLALTPAAIQLLIPSFQKSSTFPGAPAPFFHALRDTGIFPDPFSLLEHDQEAFRECFALSGVKRAGINGATAGQAQPKGVPAASGASGAGRRIRRGDTWGEHPTRIRPGAPGYGEGSPGKVAFGSVGAASFRGGDGDEQARIESGNYGII